MPDIDTNRKMILESAESLFSCCQKVGGAPPDLNMTLRDFIESYGWNGVIFSISKSKELK